MTHMDMNSIDTAIGERVHRLMWIQQVNQTHLATALNLDPAAISRRLRGRTAWKVSELLAAAKLLQVDVTDLMPAAEVIAAATATQPTLDQVTYVTKRYRIGSVRDIRPNLSRSDIVHSPSATSPKRPRTGFRAYPDTRACQKLAS